MRVLRLARKWTQAELAARLGLSQARLSEFERGAGSFTAEQLIEILRLFNVHVSHFSSPASKAPAPDTPLQNTLARLGATHLLEEDALPSDRITDANDAIREALVLGSPRLVTALAPVLVHNASRVRLPRIEASLREVGLDQRLGWLVENVVHAIREELAGGKPSREAAARLRRDSLLLETHQEAARAPGRRSRSPDVLDEDIRSKKTLEEVRAEASLISRRWNVITRLHPNDFLDALRATHGAT